MPDTLDSAELRRLAMRYAARASETSDGTERERLMEIRNALLDLARSADWLAGRRAA